MTLESPALGPFATVLTAPGRGAVAVVRIWGREALALSDRVFRPNRGRPLAGSSAGRLRVGRVGTGLGDEVVGVVLDGEPPEVEIHCHGGSAAIALVIESLVAEGGRVRPPRAWARRAGRPTIRAGAALALASAPTLKVAEILLDQAEGALDRELREVLESGPRAAMDLLDSLLDRTKVGLRLLDGWKVTLAGRPNVGKSRLFNALAGFDRAIVAPTPGTTRDVVTILAALDGWPVELSDTAGLRSSADSIEAEGVALARDRHRGADLVVVVLDRAEPLDELDRAILDEHRGALVVANKSDLRPLAWDETSVGALAVSAERGDGVEGLITSIAERLVPRTPPFDSGVPFLPGQARRLSVIREYFATGRAEQARKSLARWIGPP